MDNNKIKEMVKSALLKPMSEKINSKEYLSNRKQVKEEKNPIDTIIMDVPLFIRMMEFAREDANSDLDLHDVAEKAIELSNEGRTLTMSDYETMFGGELNEAQSSGNESLAKKVEEVVKSLTILHKNTSNNSNIPETDKKGLLRAFDMLKGDLETVVTNLKGGLSESMLDEAYVPDNIKKFAKEKGVSSLVNKAAGWAEKVGKRITGGNAIGKNYSTLILDMGYQTSDIYINTEDETIELYGEEVNSFPEFKEVYMEAQMEHDEDESSLEEGLPKGYWSKKIPGGKMEESYKILVNKIKKQGKSEKASKAIAGAIASYKSKGGGSGPTAKQKKPMNESNEDVLGDMISDMLKYKTKEEVLQYLRQQVALHNDDVNSNKPKGPTAKQKESMAETIMSKLKGKYMVGDSVTYNNELHDVVRVEDDRVYIRPSDSSHILGKKNIFWVKKSDLND